MRQIRSPFIVLFCLVVFFITIPAKGQTCHFLHYGVENGLQNRFVYTINEDSNGFLWVGTGTELVRFDGKTFRKDMLPDSLQQSFVTTSLKDNQGDLWFGFNDGYVGYYREGKFRFFDVHRFSESRIFGLAQDFHGNILVASQNGGIFSIEQEEEDPVHPLNLKEVHQISALAVSGNYLFVGTFDGLYVYRFDAGGTLPVLVKKVPEISTRVQSILPGDHDVLVGTIDSGVYRLKLGDKLTTENVGNIWGMEEANVTDILRDSRGDYWFATFGSGVIRIHIARTGFVREDYTETTGLAAQNIQCIFEDFEKNIWIGTYGKGLVLFPDDALLLFHFKGRVPGDNVTAVTAYDDRVVLGGDKGILIQNPQISGKGIILTKANGLPGTSINALFVDTKGKLWIGTRGSGIYLYNKSKNKASPLFQSGNKLENTIHSIIGNDTHVWVGTASGVMVFDLQGHLLKKLSTYEGLPYNNINQIYLDKDNEAWLATMSDGLYAISLDNGASRKYKLPETIARLQMKSIVRDLSGGFWVGTYGNGVFNITKDTILNYNENSGMISNYCYSLTIDSAGCVWVGHSSGISRIYPDKKKVRTYSHKQGVVAECNLNAAFTDQQGRVWFGTSNGVIRFNPSREKPDTIPPKTNILSITFSDKKIPVHKKIVMPYGRYRVRIDFLGISYRDPQEVMYRYKLENYDDNWSDLSSNTTAYYGRLEDGKYRFLVRAYNNAGYTTQEPVSLWIIIKHPFWKSWWFVLLSVLALITGVYIIIKVRERNHIKREEYLEKELEKRSREVLEKNAELELKNKEITDSINYARRIQSSILPPIQRLKDVFPDSFVFYQPRDIVSGDFYWWGYVDVDRFLIVCADSTGHGVPGAFMSLIGSTLIKDLTQQGRYETPSQLLGFLNREITSSLNQNLESGKSDDGMDIIVLEVNLNNNHIKFASAMRPVILFMDNEIYTLRGNRNGVGGEIIEEEKKVFNDQEYDLKKGDIIYMFSDGYPDQFGGPRGKKFKMGPLRKLLEDIHELPMDEQYEIVKKTFEEWKGDNMQIDDVLFMGLRF